MRLPTANVTATATPPRASWRRPERSIGRPVSRPTTMPPVSSATAARPRAAERTDRPARYGSSGMSAPAENATSDETPANDGRGQLERVDAEFLAGMHAQRRIGVPRDRGGHPGRGLRVGAVADERVRQLGLLGGREPGVHRAFGGDLGVHQLVLVRHRHVLSGAHREGPRDQGGHAGQDHGVRRYPAAAQPGDQRGVGHQPVHGTEHGRPQPASGYVAMPVRPPGRERRLTDRMPVLVHLLAHPAGLSPTELAPERSRRPRRAAVARRSPGQRVEGAVDGGLGHLGEAAVVVASVGPQPGEGFSEPGAGPFGDHAFGLFDHYAAGQGIGELLVQALSLACWPDAARC